MKITMFNRQINSKWPFPVRYVKLPYRVNHPQNPIKSHELHPLSSHEMPLDHLVGGLIGVP